MRNQLPASLQQKVENLQADLEARGYEVAQGYWNLFTIEDCKYMVEGAFGPLPEDTWATFRLDEREAIVILNGKMRPSGP